jgi:hypothetical protein
VVFAALILAQAGLRAGAQPQQSKIPPIAQLVGDIQGPGVSPNDLGTRIESAFDQNLDHDWFAKPGDELASTGATDTLHLIDVLTKNALDAPVSQDYAYRRAWLAICRRILTLRVPRPPVAYPDAHLDFPRAVQEIALMKLVTLTLRSSLDLWLRLDLGPADNLDEVRVAFEQARDLRDTSETAIDRQRMGDISDAYKKFHSIEDQTLKALSLTRRS